MIGERSSTCSRGEWRRYVPPRTRRQLRPMAYGMDTMRPSRLNTIVDGIFAIAMTLLIFELKVPSLQKGASAAELMQGVLALWPQAACFALSFITAGTLWVCITV